MQTSLLEMIDITKVYSNGVVANKNVQFSLIEGEIHAIAGENGAGKSTLMKILFGMESPSEGEIKLRGKKIKLSNPQDAINYGIGMVHQHFMLVPSFTVAENMVLGMEPTKGGIAIHFKEARRLTMEYAEKYKLYVDPDEKVENLSVGKKQKVEILKALVRGAKILVLDEPTAVLTPQETEELFEQLLILKEAGHTIVFISHKLKEVKTICDRITIMRAGTTQGVFYTKDVTEAEISRLMVGRDVVLKYEKPNISVAETVLKLDQLSLKNNEGKSILHHISFTVKKGQIVGIAGVEGNGQGELVRCILGQLPFEAKEATVLDNPLNKQRSMEQIRNLGLSYIPEDRIAKGSAQEGSILDNIISTRVLKKAWNKLGFMQLKKMSKLSESLVEAYKVRCSGIQQEIGMLSGGNMQKVVVAREISTEPQFLIAEQPTRGVDVGAAQLIHQKLIELQQADCGILLISADLNEVLELSDSLIVMYEGEIVAYFDNLANLTEQELGLYMLGSKRQKSEDIRERALC